VTFLDPWNVTSVCVEIISTNQPRLKEGSTAESRQRKYIKRNKKSS
jgi:hypothetical protein